MLTHFLLPLICLYQIEGLSIRIKDLGPEKIYFNLDEAKELFEDFTDHFGKKYKDVLEFNRRLEIFTRNLKDVNDRNRRSGSEVYGITQFSDLTVEEFINNYTGFKSGVMETLYSVNSNETLPFAAIQDIPDNWDWRKHGIVTPVKNQYSCGSCWAFSAVGCVEGQFARKHKQLHVLSEQQVLDCSGGGSCAGGYMEIALQGLAKRGGFVASSDYPYVNRQTMCRMNKRVLVKVQGGRRLRFTSEEQLKQLVYQYGPVSAALYAGEGYMKYRNDIASPQLLGCYRNIPANHAILIVGYGTENSKPYWIIKNSHGRAWGEDGYMRILRNVNACSLLSYIVVADVL